MPQIHKQRPFLYGILIALLPAGPVFAQGSDPRFDGIALGTAITADRMFSADLRGDGQVGNFGLGRIIRSSDPALMPTGKTAPDTETAPPPVLAAALARQIDEDPDGRFEVIVRFADDLDLPTPPLDRGARRRDGSRGAYLGRLATIRADQQGATLEALRQDGFEVDVTFRSRLLNAVGLTATGNTLARMAARPDVVGISLRDRPIRPKDPNPSNDMDDARSIIRSDFYVGEGTVANRFMAIIDTGFFSDHALFEQGLDAGLLVAWDCVESNADELCGDNPDLFPDWEPDECGPVADYHGPAVAGIAYGSDALGDAFRGVAPFVAGQDGTGLDFYKAADCSGTFDLEAIERAFEAAFTFGDEVINASFGADYTANDIADCDGDFLSGLADQAFDMGLAIFAATGNEANQDADGNASPVPVAQNLSSPACAHKVIGVGAYDVEGVLGQPTASSSFGPAGDGRGKPDLMGPTNVETVSRAGPNATEPFGGTSAATPHVAAAAMLLKGVMDEAAADGIDGIDVASVTPGHLYAMLIAMGQNGNVGADGFDARVGAGALRLRSCGRMWFGATELEEGETATFAFDIASPITSSLVAGAWWPGSPGEAHADVDLSLVSATGNTVAESQSIDSVFERVRTPFLNLTPGTWQVRAHGFDVPGSDQIVYLGIFAAGCLPTEFAPNP